MVYYNKNGEIVNYNCEKVKFNSGTQGGIYRLADDDSICLKSYVDNDLTKTIFDDQGKRFTPEMFDYFKEDFDHPSFCKLYDLMYDEKMSVVVAYTMKYYKESLENILFMPTSYLLDNFSLIYDAITQLVSDCIRVVDLSSSNIINTDDGMIVIDNDKYYMDNESDKETLSYINKSALMYAFKGIFKDALKRHGVEIDNNFEFKKMIDSLFTINTSPLVLKCKLRSYSRPIDFFYR